MSGSPRQHHYVPQLYLRGFAPEPARDAKLVVFDAKRHRQFTSSVRNLAVERDFNRFDGDRVAPDVVENHQARFESEISEVLKRIAADRTMPDGDNRRALMKFVALLLLRNPASRVERNDMAREFGATLMEMLASSRECWDRHAAASGAALAYDDIREVLDQGAGPVLRYTREGLLKQEEEMALLAVPILDRRHWCLLRSAPGAGDFCTSDNPARLHWTDLQRTSDRRPVGIGLTGTTLCLPLNRGSALIGTFEPAPADQQADEEMVAAFNALTVTHCSGQTFCGDAFAILDLDGKVRDFSRSMIWRLTGPPQG